MCVGVRFGGWCRNHARSPRSRLFCSTLREIVEACGLFVVVFLFCRGCAVFVRCESGACAVLCGILMSRTPLPPCLVFPFFFRLVFAAAASDAPVRTVGCVRVVCCIVFCCVEGMGDGLFVIVATPSVWSSWMVWARLGLVVLSVGCLSETIFCVCSVAILM